MRFLIFILLFALSLNVSSQLKKEYYDAKETQLKSETDYYKGMPHGVYTEYYQSGNVLSKGYYYSGKLNQYLGKEDSIWTFYYEDGTKKARERYEKGKKSGTNVYYFKSGKISQLTKFTDNLADSTWTSFYESGKVKSRENFEKGKKEGEWIYFYDNGQLESKGNFEKDKRQGKIESYSKTGKLIAIQEYCTGKPCNHWEEFYDNGQKKFVKEYKDSILYLMELWDTKGKQLISAGNGSLTANYDNGVIKAMGFYKGGLQDGLWRFFHPNAIFFS